MVTLSVVAVVRAYSNKLVTLSVVAVVRGAYSNKVTSDSSNWSQIGVVAVVQAYRNERSPVHVRRLQGGRVTVLLSFVSFSTLAPALLSVL